MKRNAVWLLATAALAAGVIWLATRSVKPLETAPPRAVRMEIQTRVDVDPDGVARMVSETRFTEPEVLVTMLRQMSTERESWLKSQFDQAIRDGLAEQPWETGEVAVRFLPGEEDAFTAVSDVTLYRYAWVEDVEDELWYSPGTITRQNGLVRLVSLLEMLGQRVSKLEMKSVGIAYWPAGALVTETRPVQGTFHGRGGDVRIDYRLDVFTDAATARPVVQSHFDVTSFGGGPREADLDQAFLDLLDRAGVETATRNVYIRYRYAVPPGAVPETALRSFDPAPRRWPALAFLAVALAAIVLVYTHLRKEATGERA